jgi:hypothetical protein
MFITHDAFSILQSWKYTLKGIAYVVFCSQNLNESAYSFILAHTFFEKYVVLWSLITSATEDPEQFPAQTMYLPNIYNHNIW